MDNLHRKKFLARSNRISCVLIIFIIITSSFFTFKTDSLFVPAFNKEVINEHQSYLNDNSTYFKNNIGQRNSSIAYETFFGGNQKDLPNSLFVDKSGNTFITGETSSNNFITKNAFNDTYSGSNDAFVAKFNSTGGLIFSTYIGGSSEDYGTSISVDEFGNCFVTGITTSRDFPTKNAFENTFNGKTEVFVAKFTSTGILEFSTFLGETLNLHRSDIPSIQVDNFDNSYIVVPTSTSNIPLKNSFTSYIPNTKSFGYVIAKLNSISGLIFSDYFDVNSYKPFLTFDNYGNCYITGTTFSNSFPTKNAFDKTLKGQSDIFLSKLNATGNLIYSTYLGGSGNESNSKIKIDSSDDVYIIGDTYSNDFPIKNAYYGSLSGIVSGFESKFSPNGDLLYSSYIYESTSSGTIGFSLDKFGNSYIFLKEIAFYQKYEQYPEYILKLDHFFFIKINSKGKLIFNHKVEDKSYVAPYNDYLFNGVLIDNNSNVYVVGVTYSEGFPVKPNNNFNLLCYCIFDNYISNVFILKFDKTGNLVYNAYIGDAENTFYYKMDRYGNFFIAGKDLATNHMFLAKINTFHSLEGQKRDFFFQSLFFVGCLVSSLIVVAFIALTFVEYRKYRKIKFSKNNKKNRSFLKYSLSKKSHLSKKQNQNILTNETFELIEDILKENEIRK